MRMRMSPIVSTGLDHPIGARFICALISGKTPPMTNPQQPHGPLRSFGRLKSRPVKPRQQALLDTLLPTLAIPAEPFEPRDLMPEAKQVWLEIGFGGGEHMAAQAGRRPDVLVIGA
jgi:tRNA (guanine-N7-)-methyltransferase